MTGLRGFGATTGPVAAARRQPGLESIFFGGGTAAATVVGDVVAPAADGGAVQETALAASSRHARGAVALDIDGAGPAARLEAAQLYDASAVALRQHAAGSAMPAKFLERAAAYSERALVLRGKHGAE